MEENLKIDKDYKEAFNLGYELAKELNLKCPMFEANSGNSRLSAMQDGMVQFTSEYNHRNNITQSSGLQGQQTTQDSKNQTQKGQDNGLSI